MGRGEMLLSTEGKGKWWLGGDSYFIRGLKKVPAWYFHDTFCLPWVVGRLGDVRYSHLLVLSTAFAPPSLKSWVYRKIQFVF